MIDFVIFDQRYIFYSSF